MMLAPIKFTKERQETYLDLLRKGIRRGAAARKIGLNRTTISNHSNKHPKFAAAVAQAEMDANELVEQAMFKSAIEGNVTAQQVWLYNRDPERWQDKRNITVGGDKDNPIRVEWEETRFAIVAAVDDDPVAKQKIIDALEQRR